MLRRAVDIVVAIGKLAKIELMTSLVTEIHRLAELGLGGEAPERGNVKDDCKGFNNDFDDGADEGPVQLFTDEIVVNVILEELLAFIVIASPGPEILVVAVVLCVGYDTSDNSPEDDHEEETKDGDSGEPDSCLFCLFMTTAPVRYEDDDSQGEGNASDSESSIGWPKD